MQIYLLDFAVVLLQTDASEYLLCALCPELGGVIRWLAKMLIQVYDFQKEMEVWEITSTLHMVRLMGSFQITLVYVV